MKKTENAKTKINYLRQEDVWHPQKGGPAGNAKAFKTGEHTAEFKGLKKRIRDLRKRLDAAGCI